MVLTFRIHSITEYKCHVNLNVATIGRDRFISLLRLYMTMLNPANVSDLPPLGAIDLLLVTRLST